MAYYDKKDMNDLYQQIKSSVSIKDLASRFYSIDINNKGQCCCPLHQEDTPSCMLYDYSDPQGNGNSHFKCYGCGAGGDIIAFVQKIEGIKDMPTAAVKIAESYGIPLPEAIQSGHKRTKEEIASDNAKRELKALSRGITDLQNKYAQGNVKEDDYDRDLGSLMVLYENNLETLFKSNPLSPDERQSLTNMIKTRIPLWLTQGNTIDPSTNSYKGKDIALYTRQGVKISDSFSKLVISCKEKGRFGAFVEVTPTEEFRKSLKLAVGQEWRTDPKYSATASHSRWSPSDSPSLVIHFQTKPEKYVSFTPNQYYVNVHDVVDIRTLQRTMPQKFPPEETRADNLPDYLNEPCFAYDRCILAISNTPEGKLDHVKCFKLFRTDDDIFIKEFNWKPSQLDSMCRQGFGEDIDGAIKALINSSDVKQTISLKDPRFEVSCKNLAAFAKKNPGVITKSVDFPDKIKGISERCMRDERGV